MPFKNKKNSKLENKNSDMDFGAADFPSDAISIKRLRQLFQAQFDKGRIKDGFGGFFCPLSVGQPEHLVHLDELLSSERTLAHFAFYRSHESYRGTLDQDDNECAQDARENLERYYQEFKLADSPETARLLIRLVEEEGERQAHQANIQGR